MPQDAAGFYVIAFLRKFLPCCHVSLQCGMARLYLREMSLFGDRRHAAEGFADNHRPLHENAHWANGGGEGPNRFDGVSYATRELKMISEKRTKTDLEMTTIVLL